MAQNRFETGYDKLYKASLKEDLQMTLTPGPDTYDQVEDVESKAQRNDLSTARECLVNLDKHMEEQVESIQNMGFEQRAQLAGSPLIINRYFIWGEVEGSHLIINRYFIWEEVDKAKRIRTDKGPSSAH
ncbi:hypothetical protein HAX54_005118 [Datura stramonium]|uniref:Uncharacterized protein n=1 Tax=Datura stramonium TaxID=4076 RepID=A0ABS8WVD8_DATST|nr:hypothetical protein [Datura stramonium]